MYEEFSRRWAVMLPMHMLLNVDTFPVQSAGLT